MTEHDYTELAYKNGFEAALNEEKLRALICNGFQKTPYRCDEATRAYCGSIGDCACCGLIARTIREGMGLK